MNNKSFAGFAGTFAILAGIVGLLYSVAFIVLRSDLLSALFLLLGGLFSAIALTGLYQRLREVEPSYALLAFVLSVGARQVPSFMAATISLMPCIHPRRSMPISPT